MVATDLGRAYMTNPVFTYLIQGVMGVIAKTGEAGARTPVLAALTAKEENGKYITHYQSDEDYKM